jgi:lysophospholipase L1-like esterase
MSRSWIAAAFLSAAACGGSPAKPTPPPAAPQIACPADLTVRGVTGTAQNVTYDAPTVTGGATPVNVSCSQASGGSFPLGTTTVNCTASDAQSRQAACAFNVTLTGFAIDIKKYDAVGDSFTEGQNGECAPTVVDVPHAYPTKLQAAFDATYSGQGITVINRGVGGDSVEKTVDDLRGNLAKDRPGAVLVLTGYNNLLGGGCRVSDGTNPRCNNAIDAVGLGVRDCIRHSKEAPFNIVYVFVSTLTPPGPRAPGASDRRLRSDSIVQVNSRIRQVVSAEGAILVDPYPLFIGHEPDYVDVDGLHLRPAGYQVLADTFFAAITSKIPQTPLFTFSGPR